MKKVKFDFDKIKDKFNLEKLATGVFVQELCYISFLLFMYCLCTGSLV